MKTSCSWLLWVAVCGVTHAEVTDVSQIGFTSEHELVLAASPERAYAAFVDSLPAWWDAAHSYGGNAAAFSLDARAGGCFCESLPDGGSVEHMRVARAIPGKRVVLLGGLGPLQDMGVSGSMSFSFSPHEGGSLLTYRYVVGGYVQGGLVPMAEPVDQVQLGQLRRLQRFIATGEPLNP